MPISEVVWEVGVKKKKIRQPVQNKTRQDKTRQDEAEAEAGQADIRVQLDSSFVQLINSKEIT